MNSDTEARIPVLEMSDVSIADWNDSATTCLENIAFRVQSGEFWVVAGKAGAGKTELLTTAAGLQRPLSGSVRIFGKELMSHPEGDEVPTRLHLGMVFEEGSRLLNHLNVEENVTLPLRYHYSVSAEEAAAAVEKSLQRLGIYGLRHKYPAQLFRRDRFRVALARALALRPQILLLDNPLAALDYEQVRWVIGILTDLWKGDPLMEGRPLTLVVSVDDLTPWLSQDRQFALLTGNSLQVVGPKEKLFQSGEGFVKEWLRTGD